MPALNQLPITFSVFKFWLIVPFAAIFTFVETVKFEDSVSVLTLLPPTVNELHTAAVLTVG